MALVNRGFLHYMDTKKFLKILLLWNSWSDFKIISQQYSFADPFQKLFGRFWSVNPGEWGLLALYRLEKILKKSFSLKSLVRFWNNSTWMFLGWPNSWNFDLSINMALVNWGFLHYKDMKKFFKKSSQTRLVRFWNNFTEIWVWH